MATYGIRRRRVGQGRRWRGRAPALCRPAGACRALSHSPATAAPRSPGGRCRGRWAGAERATDGRSDRAWTSPPMRGSWGVIDELVAAVGQGSCRVRRRTHVPPPTSLPRRGSQFGAQFSTVQPPPRCTRTLVTCVAANVCTPPDPTKGNWKSCWVLQPSRVQIPHPPPR